MRHAWFLAGLLATAGAFAQTVEKERAEIPEAAPVVVAGTRYQAPAFMRAQGLPRNGGYVEAVDAANGKRRWIVDVVGPRRGDGKEGDKSDVFLTSPALAPDRRHLLVADERGAHYRIDLRTRHVERLTVPPSR